MNDNMTKSIDHSERLPGLLAAFFGFLAVAGGAFGAHGLAGSVPEADLSAFETGMRYGQIHGVAALVAVTLTGQGLPLARASAWTFLAGITLFTGSLAVIGLTGSRALVLLTPLGGLAFMAGWALLCAGFYRRG